MEGPLHWMFEPFRRYADFSGRSRRMEYWMFFLLNMIIVFALFLIAGVIGGGAASMGAGDGAMGLFAGTTGLLFLVYGLAIFIPSLAVQVRRFHDQDKSGWFVLLNLIPYLGGLVVLVFMFLEGTRGENRYGPDPKGGSAGVDVA